MAVVLAVATQPCMFCGNGSIVEIEPAAYARWQAGEAVQDVWPDWTPAQRGLLTSGTHPACWEPTFEEPEPYEEPDFFDRSYEELIP